MSLESAARLISNESTKMRMGSAIRQVAATKLADPNASVKALAQAGMTAPDTVVVHFLIEAAANPAIADVACPDCGYVKAEDAGILAMVTDRWAAVAAKAFPVA